MSNLREQIEARLPITKAGAYDEMPLETYLSDPAPSPSLSASVAHLLCLRSAQHAWLAHPRLNPAWTPDATDRTDLGTIAHALLLEGDGSRIVAVDAADWRTKAAQAHRDTARAEGKLPILAHRLSAVEEMIGIARAAIAESELSAEWDQGWRERTLLWQESGVWLRTRPDWMSRDGRIVADYKTTQGSAEPDAWAKSVIPAHGYDLQALLQAMGTQALLGVHRTTPLWIVQETEPPYAVSFIAPSPAYLAYAEERLRHALALWRHCLETGVWPSYTRQTAYVEVPGWLAFREEEAT